jgi:hypothetical protein
VQIIVEGEGSAQIEGRRCDTRKVLKMVGIVLVGLIVLLIVVLISGLVYERLFWLMIYQVQFPARAVV